MKEYASYKVRNDISVSTLSKICKEICDKFPCIGVFVEVREVNDVRIKMDGSLEAGQKETYEMLHPYFETDTQRYLKIVEDEE